MTQVAETILSQLGGREFVVMCGIRNIVAHPMGLQFSVGTGAACGINRVVIMLTPSDVYTMQFYRIRKGECTLQKEYDEVYCDMLQDLFEQVTGFYTTLRARS